MKKENLKILFMGTPEFASISLKSLIDNGFNIVGVFTNPDKPSGRGMKLKESEVKMLAKEYNIPVYQPLKLKNNDQVKEILERLNPDLVIVVAYGKILPKYILEYPKMGCINVHGSLLPKYRGAAPIQWAIINGETKTGITTMYMDEGMDTGDMIDKVEISIEINDTYGTLHDKLAKVGSKLLIKTVEDILEGNIKREKQAGEFSLAPMLEKENIKIDFNNTSFNIQNLVRGTNPFPSAWCILDNERVYKIYEVEQIEYTENRSSKIGEIVCLDDKKSLFIVKCKDGYINILKLKEAGSKLMSSAEYIRGNKVKVGEIFI